MATNPLLQKGLYLAMDVYISRLSSGSNLGEFGPINMTELVLTQPDPDTKTQVSSMKSNKGAAIAAVQQTKPAELTLTFNSADKNMLAWVLQGTVATTSQGSGSGQSLQFTARHDKWVYVGKHSLTAFAISGKTEGTDFLYVAEPGLCMALSGGSISDASTVTATASYAATSGHKVERAGVTSQEFYIRGDGVNTANSNKKCMILIPDAILAPSGDLGLISEDFINFSLKGTLAVPTGGTYDFYYEEYA